MCVCVLCVSYVFYQIGNSDESSNSGLKAQTQSDANTFSIPKSVTIFVRVVCLFPSVHAFPKEHYHPHLHAVTSIMTVIAHVHIETKAPDHNWNKNSFLPIYSHFSVSKSTCLIYILLTILCALIYIY